MQLVNFLLAVLEVNHLGGKAHLRILLAHIAQVQTEHRPGTDPLAAHFRQALQEVDVQSRRGEIARQTIFGLDERHLFLQTTTYLTWTLCYTAEKAMERCPSG